MRSSISLRNPEIEYFINIKFKHFPENPKKWNQEKNNKFPNGTAIEWSLTQQVNSDTEICFQREVYVYIYIYVYIRASRTKSFSGVLWSLLCLFMASHLFGGGCCIYTTAIHQRPNSTTISKLNPFSLTMVSVPCFPDTYLFKPWLLYIISPVLLLFLAFLLALF